MKSPTAPLQPQRQAQALPRRGLLLGVGAAGAAALAAKALPGVGAPAAAVTAAALPATTAAGSYQVTAHVLRYYETTRV